LACAMQRDRHHQLRAIEQIGGLPDHDARKPRTDRPTAVVLQRVDDLAEDAFVLTYCRCRTNPWRDREPVWRQVFN
jgi:hypothetical protein